MALQKNKESGSLTLQGKYLTIQAGVYVSVVGQVNFQADLSAKCVTLLALDSTLKISASFTVKAAVSFSVGRSIFAIHTSRALVTWRSVEHTKTDLENRGTDLNATLRSLDACDVLLKDVGIVTSAAAKDEECERKRVDYANKLTEVAEKASVHIEACTAITEDMNQTFQTVTTKLQNFIQSIESIKQTFGENSEQFRSLNEMAGQISLRAASIHIN